MTTARAAARAARLEAAMNAAVARVRAALPAIGAEDATAALEEALPATMKGKGPARFLEELVAHVTAHPDALTSGNSLCPSALLRLTRVLHEAGHPVVRPGCAHCGKVTADLRQLREEGRICSSCDSRSRKGTCGRCGATGVQITARRPEGVICDRCYRRDPEVVEACAECGRVRIPVVRLPDGGALCHACRKRPRHTCVSCGKNAPAALLAEEGAYCLSCPPAARDPHGEIQAALHSDRPGRIGPPVKLGLYGRRALAKDAGVPPEGDGSHRLAIGGDIGAFTDPDGFEWEGNGQPR